MKQKSTEIITPFFNACNVELPPRRARFSLANNVLLAGVRSVTDLMVNPGLINLDFADVQVNLFVC